MTQDTQNSEPTHPSEPNAANNPNQTVDEKQQDKTFIEPEIAIDEPDANHSSTNQESGHNSEESNPAESNETTEASSEVVESDSPKKEDENSDFKAKYFYLAAEMENFRKRMLKEKQELIKYSNEQILSDLLEVLDNFDRIVQTLPKDTELEVVKNINIGIEMVQKQFLEVLNKHGLEPINSIGETFDPAIHEAISQLSVPGKKDSEIIEETAKGYILNGRVLRASKVVVNTTNSE